MTLSWHKRMKRIRRFKSRTLAEITREGTQYERLLARQTPAPKRKRKHGRR